MKTSCILVAMFAIVGAVIAADQPAAKTSVEAFEKAQASKLPDGVTLTGVTEKIDPPANVTASIKKEAHEDNDSSDDDKKEHFGWGLGGWGGWGGYGPYRFGFTCGGIPGWAYPIGFWNMYGAGLYGGGCGLGVPFGGLYYC